MSRIKSMLVLSAVILGIILVLAFVIVLRMSFQESRSLDRTSPQTSGEAPSDGLTPIYIPTDWNNQTSSSAPSEEKPDRFELTERSCEQAGGHWNACSSPCRGQGDVICIEVCEEVCECGGIAGFSCPSGYYCDYDDDSSVIADAFGVCRKNRN